LKSVVTDKFRKAFAKLPNDVQEKARQTYRFGKKTTAIQACTLSKYIKPLPFILFVLDFPTELWA
jgi:hypothetical protein